MQAEESQSGQRPHAARFVLGVDTCGPSGSVALARIDGDSFKLLSQVELPGRSYSARLVAAVAELLAAAEIGIKDLGAMVVVSGPGSFTGVRVGLSAVKGLAEPNGTSVLAVSRLEVLAWKANLKSAVLDAHRHEIFLRIMDSEGARELLAGADELKALPPFSTPIAVCDQSAESLLREALPGVELSRTDAPTAADTIQFALPQIHAGRFADLVLLDGHYLRRSDAEIFGETPRQSRAAPPPALVIRPMAEQDLDAVMSLAASLPQAPSWTRDAYLAAANPQATPRRIALVAEEAGSVAGFVVARLTPPEAELETIVVAASLQRRGIARRLFAELANEIRPLHGTELSLEVRASNGAARAFYRSLGFAESGRRPRYYADPVEDALLMRLGQL